MTVRILIWNLFDSKTTLEELREHLPDLPDGSHWISHGDERFGLFALGDEPAVAEEFDVE